MERRAAVLALALTLPLVLYGVPYAYAVTTSSTYVVNDVASATTSSLVVRVHCNTGDYATGGGVEATGADVVAVGFSEPLFFDGTNYFTVVGGQPNAWVGGAHTTSGANVGMIVRAWVVCQTPITVAGIGVPEFGSLYAAIALGAVAYFMLSRRFARRPTISAEVQA
jgi:hypothetical protein